jgi:hypothetical protein
VLFLVDGLEELGADYVAVPLKIIKRRFSNVSEIEISEFIEEAKLEDSSIDVILEYPIPGIAPVRGCSVGTPARNASKGRCFRP